MSDRRLVDVARDEGMKHVFEYVGCLGWIPFRALDVAENLKLPLDLLHGVFRGDGVQDQSYEVSTYILASCSLEL